MYKSLTKNHIQNSMVVILPYRHNFICRGAQIKTTFLAQPFCVLRFVRSTAVADIIQNALHCVKKATANTR